MISFDANVLVYAVDRDAGAHHGTADLADAMRAAREHGLSFWDAMLWATVRRVGVRVLISEDFQDGRTIEGVRIVNPSVPGNAVFLDEHLPVG